MYNVKFKIPKYLYDNKDRIFLLGDPHFMDYNCFNCTRKYSFSDIKEMTKIIVDNIYRLPDNITLIINGDIYNIDFLSACCWNKHVLLQMGNHDLNSFNHPDYKTRKIDKMKNELLYDIKIIDDPYYLCDNIVVSHKPIKPLNFGILNIHAHYHNLNGLGNYSGIYSTGEWPENQYYNTAIDNNNMNPISLRNIFLNMKMNIECI